MPRGPDLLKRIGPFIFSVTIHLGLLAFVFSAPSSQGPSVKIEVLWQKSARRLEEPPTSGTHATNKVPPQPPTSESTAIGPAQKVSARSDLNSENEERTSKGFQGTPILGSSVGIQAYYPRVSRTLGETGSVVIAVQGQSVSVSMSSGFQRLDQSALEATQAAVQGGLLPEDLLTAPD